MRIGIHARGASLRLLLVLLVSCLAAPGVAKPLPSGPDAPVYATFGEKVAVPFFLRLTAEAYLRVGLKDPAWDAAAVAFLEKSARAEAMRDVDTGHAHERAAEGEAVVALGCKDPAVLYFAARARQLSGHEVTAFQQYRAAADAMRDSEYDPALKAIAFFRVTECEGLPRPGEIGRPAQEAGMDYLRQAVDAKTFGPGEERILLDYFLVHFEDTDIDQLKALHATVVDAGAEPWLVETIDGVFRIRSAWRARGSGWAGGVKPASWKQFAEHLAEARRHLILAWDLNPHVPHAAAQMISVVMGEPDSKPWELRAWFDRAVEAELDYMPAYNILLWAYYPRWGGDYPTMYALGLECAQTRRYDTEVPYYFLRVLIKIRDDDSGATTLWKSPGAMEAVTEVVKGYVDHPHTSAGRKRFLRTIEAAVASKAEHWQRARAVLDELQGEPDAAALALLAVEGDDMASVIYAMAGPHADEIERGTQLAYRGNLPGALEVFEKLETMDHGSPPALKFITGRANILRWRVAFDRGDAVALRGDERLAGWRVVHGSWKSEPDGSIVGTSSRNGLLLLTDANFGSSWELTCTMDFLGGGVYPSSGLVFSWRSRDDSTFFMIHKWNSTFSLTGVDARPAPLKPGGDTLRIRFNRGIAEAWINDKPVMTATRVADLGEPTDKFGLGGIWYDAGRVRYRDIQIRKIPDDGGDAGVEFPHIEDEDPDI